MLGQALNDWIYRSPSWLSSTVFVLAGIVASGFILVVLTRLVREETRHLHNEFTLFTVTNIAVLYAVLLAFIAIAAWEDQQKASEAVEKEASLIEALYLDAQGIEDKGLVGELRMRLRHYVETVTDREWPVQRAGHVPDAAARFAPYSHNVSGVQATDVERHHLEGGNAQPAGSTSSMPIVTAALPPAATFPARCGG
jgi:hypothetical protein